MRQNMRLTFLGWHNINQVKFLNILSKIDKWVVDVKGRKISKTVEKVYFINKNGHENGYKYKDFDASKKCCLSEKMLMLV